MNLLGTRVRISASWAVVVALAWAGGALPQLGLAVAGLLGHELAHLTVAAALDRPLEELVLYPFGGVARGRPRGHDPPGDLLVAVAGPLSSFLLAGLGHYASGVPALFPLLDPGRLRLWVDVNLGMAMLNLLPALPLDGGSLVRGALALRLGEGRAARILWSLGRVLGLGLMGAAALGAWQGLLPPAAVLLGAFVAWAAAREGRQDLAWAAAGTSRRRARLARRQVVEGRLLVAAEGATLGEVRRAMGGAAYHLVAVVAAGDARLLGTLGEAAVEEGLLHLGPQAPVGRLVGG